MDIVCRSAFTVLWLSHQLAANLLSRCFGGLVLEGYGMTETSCVISGMDVGDNLTGHVGSPHPACGEYEYH